MKEFYAEECGQDYGVMCWQEQTRQSVTKELLEEILKVQIIKFEIDFDGEIIDYMYSNWTSPDNEIWNEISLNDFFEKAYALDSK